MNKLLAFLLTVLFFKNTNAQLPVSYIDEKRENIKTYFIKLKGHLKDTAKVNLYNEIANAYAYFNSDSSFLFAKMSLEISTKINYTKGKNEPLRILLNTFRDNGDYSSALKYAVQRYRLNENVRDTSELLWSLDLLVDVLKEAKDYQGCLDYSKKGIIISELNKSDSSLIYFNQNTGFAFLNLGKNDSALKYYNRAYETSLNTKNESGIIFSLRSLASYYNKIKDYDLALGYLNKANLMYPYYNDYGLYSEIFYNKNNLDSALKYAYYLCNKGNISLSSAGDSANAIKPIELMLKIYQKQNIKDSILKYQALLISLQQFSFNADKIKTLENIKFKDKVRDIELEEQKLKAQEERRRNIKLGLIAVFIPMFAGIVYLISRKKKKNTKIITLMGLASLLMFFEFISLLIHPYIEKLTHHDAILMYLILLVIASILVPLHHKLESYVKSRI